MSKTNFRIPLQTAKNIAQKTVAELAPFCGEIEIAGSIRRECETVGDIEIVCILNSSLSGEKIGKLIGGKLLKDGERYKKFLLPNDINIDIYIVKPPAQWGFILAQRTGPAEFNQRLYINAHRKNVTFEGGCVYVDSIPVETPTEELFFKAIGSKWIDPIKRRKHEHKDQALKFSVSESNEAYKERIAKMALAMRAAMQEPKPLDPFERAASKVGRVEIVNGCRTIIASNVNNPSWYPEGSLKRRDMEMRRFRERYEEALGISVR